MRWTGVTIARDDSKGQAWVFHMSSAWDSGMSFQYC